MPFSLRSTVNVLAAPFVHRNARGHARIE
jgi:hypothetical protein